MHYTINLDIDAWLDDDKTQQAVERNFEIIGEVIKRLRQHYPEVVARIPDHARAYDFRNFLIHQYDAVDPDEVWGTIRKNIPELHATVRDLIAELESTDKPDHPRSRPGPL